MSAFASKTVLLSVLLLFAGCAVAPTEPVDPNALQGPRSGTSLTKGMTAETVRELWGDPLEIRELKAESETAEVWLYERFEVVNMGQIESGSIEVPYIDPVTGESRMVNEPRYETKFDQVKVITELLMFEGKLIEWKQSRQVRENY